MKKHHEATSNKRCLVCVTQGSEDLETVAIVDTLRRSKRIEVTLAKVFAPGESTSASDLKTHLECKMMMGTRLVSSRILNLCGRLQIQQLRMCRMSSLTA
jgi:hypothetical protein